VPPRSNERRPSPGVGSPLEWSVIERCRLMIVLTLPFYVGYGLRSAYLITHPEIEPYFSRAWLVVMRDGIAVLVALWSAFLLFGWLERRRAGSHTLYALVGTLSWWVGAAAIAYGLGPVTSPAWIAILVGVVCQLLLLPRSLALAGIAFGLCLVAASMVAVGVGAIPYAPMMSAAPFVDGHIELPHLIGATAASIAATLGLLGVVQYIMTQWRDAHEHLAQVNANLERIVEQRTHELVAAEAQLRQVEKMEAIGRLAGGIAHDFNNLLAVITGYADLLLSSSAALSHRQELAEIKAAGSSAARLARQLLAVGRREMMKPEPLQLDEVVRQTLEMLRPLVGEDVELRLSFASDLGQVEADPMQMKQVVLNLATNARDAMPRGGTLTIETANLDVEETTLVGASAIPAGAWVTLRVTDTGAGMDQEVQARVFEPFFTTKLPGRGTGLGLSSVFGIVAQSGGLVSLESELGRGTSLCIYLPRLALPRKVATSPAEPRESCSRAGTLLLVEDDPALRRLLERTLSEQRHTVLQAADGHEALELARRHSGRLDVLLTDVVMPRGSGRELAEELVKIHPEAAVIFMTGYTDDAVLLRGVLAHEVRLLRKPFKNTALSAALAELLGPADGG
jgi:signal transduction histidine kinase/ActR/RegA family two-component response regulator